MHAVCLLFHVKVGLVNTNMNCMIITLDLDMLQECIAFFSKNFCHDMQHDVVCFT